MLSLQVNLLKEQNDQKTGEISELKARVDTLQNLVTQRADVEAVKVVVDKIAVKVGAE
jgi:maltodextrin utilization protein YvdJ